MQPEPLLTDTNIFVHLVRGDRLGEQIKSQYDLLMTATTPAYCVVSEGEIRSLAYQWNWSKDKVEQMSFLLGYFHRLPIETPEVITAYATIDAYSKRLGITMGKNDVWIAAVAHVGNFKLLTTDRDFDHLHEVFLLRDRITLLFSPNA